MTGYDVILADGTTERVETHPEALKILRDRGGKRITPVRG